MRKALSLQHLGIATLVAVVIGLATASHPASAQYVETKLVASDGSSEDMFGGAVALSGSTLIAGAHRQRRDPFLTQTVLSRCPLDLVRPWPGQ